MPSNYDRDKGAKPDEVRQDIGGVMAGIASRPQGAVTQA